MNTASLLKKCIDKIKGMTGNDAEIQYVLGILETLYEMQTPENTVQVDKMTATAGGSTIKLPVNVTRPPVTHPEENMSESAILEKQAQERLKGIKDVAI